MALTRVSPSLFATSNNITSVTVGGSANTISLTFDASGVITGASNNALLISNTAITGNIISSQITSVANTQITGNIISSQISPSVTLYGNPIVTGNLTLDTTATSKLYLSAANTVKVQTANTTALTISSAQIVDFANAPTIAGSALGGIAPTIQVFTATGTSTYTKPAGLKAAFVRLVGGGGGGPNVNNSETTGNGGGGGGYSERLIAAGSIGATETVTVGTGGTAGTMAGNGTGGGTTSFGTLLSATGGSGGVSPRPDSPTAGGAGTGGSVNISGGTSQREDGGSSLLGLGGGPGADDRSPSSGGAYGGGGGAALNPNNGPTGRDGGNGGNGIVIVIEYY